MSPALIVCYAIIGLCWITFLSAWAILAMVFGGSERRHSPSRAWLSRILFVIAMFAAVSIRTWHGAGVFGTRHGPGFFAPPLAVIGAVAGTASAAAGAALCFAGVAFGIWARVTLGRNWGMPMSLHDDPELVTAGPYRYVRHPIYTAVASMWIGTSLAYPLGALPSVFVIGYLVFAALREERDMSKRFPEAYPEYKKHSKMLVPFVI